MIAVCWHFAYGIWLFAAKWGITPGEVARKRFGYVCLAFGILLAVMGLASIWAFVSNRTPAHAAQCRPHSPLQCRTAMPSAAEEPPCRAPPHRLEDLPGARA